MASFLKSTKHMKTKTVTEWLIKLQQSGEPSVHTAVVYSLEAFLDENGSLDSANRLWVAARGYGGGGVYEEHTAVATFSKDGGGLDKISRAAQSWPDESAFIDGPFATSNDEILTDTDYKVFETLWAKVEEFTSYDIDQDEAPFVSRITLPEDDETACSDEWDPDDLLEPISNDWGLMLKF